jgi:hypothetical protein
MKRRLSDLQEIRDQEAAKKDEQDDSVYRTAIIECLVMAVGLGLSLWLCNLGPRGFISKK